MDTTSLYFEGAGGQTLGRHGFSKDHRLDVREMILAVLIDGDGRPVCSKMWPGQGRQGAHWEYRLSPLPQDDQQRPLCDRSGEGGGGCEVRWDLRAAHQHRPEPARSHAVLLAKPQA